MFLDILTTTITNVLNYQVDGDNFRCLSRGEDFGDGSAVEGAVDLLVSDVKTGIRQASGGILKKVESKVLFFSQNLIC